MKLFKYKILLFLLICFSCDHKEKTAFIFSDEILLEDNLLVYIDEINLVELNTPEYVNNGTIEKIVFYKYEIILLENGTNNSLLFFDRFGNFRKRLVKLGSGPGEYFNIDFFMITQDLIYIYDRGKMSFLIYDYNDLNFVKSIKLDYYLLGGMALNDENNLFIISDHELDDGNYKGYGFVNFNLNTEKFFSRKPAIIEGFQSSAIVQSDNQILFIEAFTEKIYQISPGLMKEINQINFGSYEMSTKIMELQEAEDFYELLDQSDFRFVSHHYMDQNNWRSFNFYHKNTNDIRVGLHHVESGVNYTLKSQNSFESLLLEPITVHDNLRYLVLYPGEVKKEDLSKLGISSVNNITLLSYQFNIEKLL